MTESTDVAVVDQSTTPSLANQFDIVDVEAAKAFMNNYQELVNALLDPSDYHKGKKKKSAWRKLATAFNISDEIVHHEETRDENGQIISAKFFVKAILPNGRSAVNMGKCSIYDKIRYHGEKRDIEQPSDFELRGRFNNAEHDVPATAHTRAKSRAISDLIGSGEVSAEELENIKGNAVSKKPPVPKKQPAPKKAPAPKPKEEPIETKAEVVEAEVVTEETEKPKKKSMTIKELMDNNQHIKKAVHALQDQEINVSRATISEKLMDLWDMGKIEKADYDIAIEQLKQ